MYFNKDFETTSLPYGLHPLVDKLAHLQDKRILITSIPEYSEIVEIPKSIDLMILYEWSGWSEIPNLSNTSIPVIVLHNNFKYFYNNTPNCFYYPQWLFYVRDLPTNTNPIKPKYLISSANRNFNNGRPGKIYNYQLLKNKLYFDKILISKFKSMEQFDLHAIPEINISMITDFLTEYDTWEILNYNELDLINSMNELDIEVYTKSLFHLVAETRIQEQILSEKTYKVFLVKQIPIMCGAQHSIKHLRDLGFDMFDDIIDHSYDSVDHWEERIVVMHQSLDNITQLDHACILNSTESRRIQNLQYLYSAELANLILNPIKF